MCNMQNLVMENTYAGRSSPFEHAGRAFRSIDLLGYAGARLLALPWVHRLLLENVLRCAAGEG